MDFGGTLAGSHPGRGALSASPPELQDKLMIFWRPVGLRELELIAQTEYKAFPPRLPEQPIFYPVLTREYAEQIARDWNAKHDGGGYVTRFEIDADFVQRYSIQTVGGSIHQELWVPADELPEFNRNIVGVIEVIASFPPVS